MTIVDSIEAVREWLEKNVCSQVKLKLPPGEDATDENYNYTLVTPASFALFVPAADRLPPGADASIPSVCVQLVQGTDTLTTASREMRLRLSFSAWNPGKHKKDIFISMGNGEFRANSDDSFQKDDDGWRDVWNFTDTALREIENADSLNGVKILHSKGITFGVFSEEKATPNFWPYWFSWVEFTAETGITRAPEYLKHL